jgi:hypothetical protein
VPERLSPERASSGLWASNRKWRLPARNPAASVGRQHSNLWLFRSLALLPSATSGPFNPPSGESPSALKGSVASGGAVRGQLRRRPLRDRRQQICPTEQIGLLISLKGDIAT